MSNFKDNIVTLRKHLGSNRNVACNLGVSERAVYRAIADGGNPRIRLHAEQLVELIRLRAQNSTEPQT